MKKLFGVLTLLAALSIMFISCKKDDTDKGQGENNPDQDGGHVHAFLDWSFVTEPTCTAGGLCESYCECGDYQTKTLPAKGHNFVGLVCDSCGEINAEVTSDEYFVFTELDDGSYSIAAKDVKNMPGVVVIPSTHKDKPVTKIADCAFYKPVDGGDIIEGSFCLSLEYLSIPDSVTSIGNMAFANCYYLKRVSIPNSVTEIGDYAFALALSLEEVDIPDQLETIGEGTFGMCTSLKTVDIPNSVKRVNGMAFGECLSLSRISIPESVMHIGEDAFMGCSRLIEIINHSYFEFNDDFCNDVGLLYGNLFEHDIHSGESKLVERDNYLFYPIDGEITLVNYLGSDEDMVLPNDFDGEEYAIHYSFFVTWGSDEIMDIIEQQTGVRPEKMLAFPYIKSVLLPDFITEIDSDLFSNCFSLEKIKIRETSKLQRIAEDAFERCQLFKYNEDEYAYYVGNDENPYLMLLTAKDNITFFESKPETIYIAERAFVNNNLLTEIVLSDEIKEIREYTFATCGALQKITFPRSLEIINIGAFCNCDSLTSINLPDSVTVIGEYAFMNCQNLSNVVLSDNLYSIGEYAFGRDFPYDEVFSSAIQCNEYDGCKYLGSKTNPYLVLISARDNKSANIEMRDDTRLIYYGAFSTNRNLESVVIGKSVIGIGESAFNVIGSEGRLASVKLPDSLLYIGEMAFFRSKHLTSITIPDSVKDIGGGAFYGCESLNNVVVPNSVTAINEGTFKDCKSLTNIVIPNTVVSIGNEAFSGCNSLESIIIPNSVTSIDYCSFAYCSSLTSIVIPNGVTSIGFQSFVYCRSLTSIVIPDSVTSIEPMAFLGCTSLTDIYYTGTEEEWNMIDIWQSNSEIDEATIHFNYTPEE